MDVTPEWEELAAASALAALDPETEALLERLADAEPEVARRRDDFRQVVAALDEDLARPPADLTGRTRLLAAAAQRRPSTVEPAPSAEVYRRQIEALVALLDELTPQEWNVRAAPYEWSVHGLVAHLLVVERYTAHLLGLRPEPPQGQGHLEMGAQEIAAELAGPPAATAARWAETALANAAALAAADRSALPADLALHGWPLSLEGGTIARAFEIWTHADDVRRATGRPLANPAAADVRTMSSYSVAALPLLFPLAAGDAALPPTRVVLTGPGGGTFDLTDVNGRGSEAERSLLVADVVDYCRVAAKRIAPDDLDCTIEGDRPAMLALLGGASAFAM